jgi:hypothetical protein
MTQRLLEVAGIGRGRLHLEWLSSAEAQRFVDVARNATETVRTLGPLDRQALGMQLEAALMTVTTETMRWMVGKEVAITRKGDVYGRSWSVGKYEAFMDAVLEREYQKNLIYLAIREGHTSVRAVHARTGLPVLRVSYLLADLEKTNRVEFKGMHERIPSFAVI